MRKLVYSLLLCILFSSLNTKAQQIIEGFSRPESVIKVGDKLFVSNISAGSISELSADGKFIEKNFQKGTLHAPKGLAVLNNTIYVTDTDRVVGFNINSGVQTFELGIPKSTFLNDLCTVGQNRLAVTDSRSGNVYIINTAYKAIQFLGSIAGANGVTYNERTKQLYACGMGPNFNGEGKLYVKDLNKADTLFAELPNSPTGRFDGIELIDNDHLIVDDWTHNGRLFVYNLKDNSSVSYTVNCSTADLYYDKATDNVYIPDMLKNRIIIEKLSSLKKD